MHDGIEIDDPGHARWPAVLRQPLVPVVFLTVACRHVRIGLKVSSTPWDRILRRAAIIQQIGSFLLARRGVERLISALKVLREVSV